MIRWFVDRSILGFLGRGGHGNVGVATAEEINYNCATGSASSFDCDITFCGGPLDATKFLTNISNDSGHH